ncbi:MAG: hypothetical protein HRU49_11410 [Winogradskyella sp.]|uniref:hypothetical protein n=1 Tax=Winogradskyella sp. TaxID=1883156 RepID=UPI0025FF4172|nr:hypothetical protein [Winogradskyella sp.]NRB84364.1 hypothetical protein [Winogradskyella sp.]
MSWINTIFKKVNTNSKSPKKQKQFGYLLGSLFIVFFCVSVYKNGWQLDTARYFMVIAALSCFLLTVIFKKGFYPLLLLWLLFGELLGKLTNFLVLSIIYYFVFTPIVLILNLFNKKERYKPLWTDRKTSIDYDSLS